MKLSAADDKGWVFYAQPIRGRSCGGGTAVVACPGCAAAEEWREHPGHAGLWISNLGQARADERVFSQRNRWGGEHTGVWPARTLKHTRHSRGYLLVTFQRRQFKCHVLMLECFVGPRPAPDWHGCHRDDQPAHNCLVNLRWDTPQGNKDDEVARNGQARIFGQNNPFSKLSAEAVRQIKDAGQTESYAAVARKFGTSRSQVSRIARGLSRGHG